MIKLKGAKVLITGGAGGIGLCTAEEFAKAGGVLILTDIDADALAAAAAKLQGFGATVHTRVVDVANRAQVDDLACWVEKDLGGLDVLINNAGVGYQGEMKDMTLEHWKRLIDINLWGPLHHIYAFMPAMLKRKKGWIVNVSSGQVYFRLPTWSAYAAIKAALGLFSEVLHFELAPHGVGVTTVYPYLVRTPFYRGMQGDSWGSRLSLKVLPYVSQSPETVGKVIFKAVRKGVGVENVTLLNDVANYGLMVPGVRTAFTVASTMLLRK